MKSLPKSFNDSGEKNVPNIYIILINKMFLIVLFNRNKYNSGPLTDVTLNP